MANDDLEAIDRLFALKQQGVLTTEEFELEKSRILEGQSSTSNDQAYPDADEAHDMGYSSNRSKIAPLLFLALMVAAVAGSWHFGLFGMRAQSDESATSTTGRDHQAWALNAKSEQPVAERLSEEELLNRAFAKTLKRIGSDLVPRKLVSVAPDLFAVIATAEGAEAHAAGGKFAVQYARRANNQFSAVGKPLVIEAGSFGAEPGWIVRTDLGEQPIVVVEGGGTWQGCTSSTIDIVELTTDQPRHLINAPIGYSNEDEDGNAVEYEGVLEGGQSGLQIRYSGSVDMIVALTKSGGKLVPSEPLPSVC